MPVLPQAGHIKLIHRIKFTFMILSAATTAGIRLISTIRQLPGHPRARERDAGSRRPSQIVGVMEGENGGRKTYAEAGNKF